jgi:hypothetical protein
MTSFKQRVEGAFFLRWFVVAILIVDACHGFVTVTSDGLGSMGVPSMSTIGSNSCYHRSSCSNTQRSQLLLCQFALTERQMQFWEDVDEGLNDIEAFFLSSKGMDIDRVRRFAKRYDIRRGLSASLLCTLRRYI